MSAPEVLAQLRRFDDETWTALASVGLLRRARKDLTAESPALLDDTADEVVVAIGGQTVRFGAGGPADARCTCPSATICRHIVAAGVWLAESAGPPAVDAPEGSAHDELMAMGPDDFTRHAGSPGHRWAWRFVDELDDADVAITRGDSVQIAFPRLQVTFRYAGGGLGSLIADQKLTQLARYQVAAALVYQRANGRALDSSAAPKTVGKQQESQSANRQRMRHSTRQLLLDTVQLGIAHPSVGLHERYETTAVWAQGAEYPRLSLLLTRIADHVEQILQRSATVGTSQLVAEIAVAFALVEALEAAAVDGHEPSRLVGQARNQYTPVRSLEVIGMGSVPWQAASGYHGLTTLFWWADQRRFLSLTDARPVDLWGFDPLDRHDEPGPWQGLASPHAAAGRRIELTQARVNPAGRLSAVESTGARVESMAGTELAAMLEPVDRWSELRAGHLDTRALLDPPDPLSDWVVLQPREFGDAHFDQTTQTLRWYAADVLGDEVVLTVRYSLLTATAIQRIEALEGRVAVGTLLVARVGGDGIGLTAEPLSLINPDAENDPVDSLYFGETDNTADAAPPRSVSPVVLERIPRREVALRTMRAWLVRAAERGTAGGRELQLHRELVDQHRRLRDQGFALFPADLDVAVPSAELLLRSYCLAEQLDRVLARAR